MNKVMLIGNLTKDPELATTTSGISVCKFSLAVGREYKNAEGEYETDFFNIVVWRIAAENCNKYLKKGSKVAVLGSIQNRSYDAQDGTKRYVTDIVADKVEFLSTKNEEKIKDVDKPIEVSNEEKIKEALGVKNNDDSLPF
jgi:single-strand DNA-binding protein